MNKLEVFVVFAATYRSMPHDTRERSFTLDASTAVGLFKHIARRAVSAARPPTRPVADPTRPADHPPSALQTTTDYDDSQQNNTGPLGKPVKLNAYTGCVALHCNATHPV